MFLFIDMIVIINLNGKDAFKTVGWDRIGSARHKLAWLGLVGSGWLGLHEFTLD
jgi:hypothetical protein